MPLIIGNIKATITVGPSTAGVSEQAPTATGVRDSEVERMRALSAERFESERKIVQRDPQLLGGA